MIPGLSKPTDSSRRYTTAEVARLLGVGADHVRHCIASEKIIAVDVGVGRVEYRISEDEVERLLAARGRNRL